MEIVCSPPEAKVPGGGCEVLLGVMSWVRDTVGLTGQDLASLGRGMSPRWQQPSFGPGWKRVTIGESKEMVTVRPGGE